MSSLNTIKRVPKIVSSAAGRVKSKIYSHPKFLPAYSTAYKILPRQLMFEGADKKVMKIDMSRKEPLVKDINKDQLKIGTEIEYEHTDKEETAKKIATDHIKEFPFYYDALVPLEDCMEQVKSGRADGIIMLAVKSDALYSITKLLHYLKAMGSQGHSLQVKADKDSFGFDGDGSDKIRALHAFRYSKDGKSH